ncbi:MAG: GNAT family N-acetyltransferase [Candidatus Rokuibacteriota bacterium]
MKRGCVDLRRLAPHEVELHQDLRLRALRDAPDSFGETAADAATRSRAYWEELTRAVTTPGGQAMFLACEDAHVIGTVYGLLDRERGAAGRVGGMWVEAAWRGQGVGRRLLLEVLGWARARGLSRLGLWAPAHSPAAIALYSRAGFRDTGDRRPLPGNASLQLVAMEAEL